MSQNTLTACFLALLSSFWWKNAQALDQTPNSLGDRALGIGGGGVGGSGPKLIQSSIFQQKSGSDSKEFIWERSHLPSSKYSISKTIWSLMKFLGIFSPES